MTTYAWFVRGNRHAALCQTSMAAVRKADPKARLVVATDEPLTIPDADMIRFDPGLPLMVANVEAQLAVMWAIRTPIVFLDTDVLFLKPFPEQEQEGVTVTWRDTVGGKIEDMEGGVADVMPFNYGVLGVYAGFREIEAFIWLRERIKRMAPALQQWWGNQVALASLCGPRPTEAESIERRQIPWRVELQGPLVTIRKVPGAIWNYTPRDEHEDLTGKGAVHFKGHTRGWMQSRAEALGLPWMREAA